VQQDLKVTTKRWPKKVSFWKTLLKWNWRVRGIMSYVSFSAKPIELQHPLHKPHPHWDLWSWTTRLIFHETEQTQESDLEGLYVNPAKNWTACKCRHEIIVAPQLLLTHRCFAFMVLFCFVNSQSCRKQHQTLAQEDQAKGLWMNLSPKPISFLLRSKARDICFKEHKRCMASSTVCALTQWLPQNCCSSDCSTDELLTILTATS